MSNSIVVSIMEACRQLTKLEEARVKDSTAAISLNEAVDDSKEIRFTPAYWARISVTNTATGKQFEKLVIVTVDGKKYTTGSNSFLNTFLLLYKEFAGEAEPVEYVAVKRASKNYPGKGFLVCAI